MSSELVQKTRAAEMRREPLAAKLYEEGPAFSLALADRVGVDRFVLAAVTSFKTTPRLAECDWDTVMGGLYVAAQLGLEVGGPRGLAYLVPYGRTATLVLGYKGWVDLMYRAGARSVQWFLVREGDQFRIGSDAVHGMVYDWHPQDLDEKRDWNGAVAQVILANGGLVWDYMTKEQILARRPEKWSGTPWKSWPEEMALKTVLKHLAKRIPMSTELSLAVSSDDTVQRRLPGVEEHAVEHVPVAGPPALQERPQERAQTAPKGRQRPADAPAAPPPPQAPPEDDQAAYEAQSDAEYQAWLATQEPM